MGDALQIDCPAQMDIAGVSELYDTLRQIDDEATVVFNASEVERVDAAGLQLLCAFMRDAPARRITVQWQSPSPTLLESAGLLGLKPQLGLESAE